MKFELSNTQRQYLGLKPVENHWEKVQLNAQICLYFEADTIKKEISISENYYAEKEMDEATENRTVLLPKTKRGKPKKLNFTAISKRDGIGTYFRYTKKQGVTIGNYDTQKTYYSSYFLNEEIPDFTALNNWIASFIADSKAKDLADIKAFGTEKRKRIKIKEGDFFCYKIGRRNYGFGRILLDVRKLRKDASFDKQKNRGLASLMGQPLAIKVYHAISDSKNIDIDNLKSTLAFPSQYIMDNRFFYGDYDIIGHAPLKDQELDFPIHFSPIFESGKPTGKSHLQWGLIHKEAAP